MLSTEHVERVLIKQLTVTMCCFCRQPQVILSLGHLHKMLLLTLFIRFGNQGRDMPASGASNPLDLLQIPKDAPHMHEWDQRAWMGMKAARRQVPDSRKPGGYYWMQRRRTRKLVKGCQQMNGVHANLMDCQRVPLAAPIAGD